MPDTAVTKLSYWTDNGAYYFGKNLVRPDITLPGLLDSLLNDSHVDVGLLQLDGWWMQNPHLAANPKYFPDWEKFLNRLGHRGLLLYKSFFDEHDDLFNVSGCKVQSSKTGWWYPCAETAHQVYTHMFIEGKKLGMTAYETDFMVGWTMLWNVILYFS